jgi:hypothetical protein
LYRYALPGKGGDKDETGKEARRAVDVIPAAFSVGAGPKQDKAGGKLRELLVRLYGNLFPFSSSTGFHAGAFPILQPSGTQTC